MKRKRIYTIGFSILLSIQTFFVHSQTVDLYYNEKFQQIDKKVFQRKLTSKLFLVTSWKKDTTICYKLRYAEFFGKMDSIKHQQFRKQLSSKYKLNPNKTWLFYYIDSLPNTKKMHERSGMVFIDPIAKDSIFVPRNAGKSARNFDREKYHQHFYKIGLNDFKKNLEKSIRKKPKNIELFYLYNYNKGFPITTSENYKLFQDPNKIAYQLFSDGQINYHGIILDTEGNFYMTNLDNSKMQNKLLTRKGFLEEKEKWGKKLAQLGI